MLKLIPLLSGISCLAFALSAQAQLASNPWKTTSPQVQQAPVSRIQALGQAQAEKARQVRAAQIQRASSRLQAQRASNSATPATLAEQNQMADAIISAESQAVPAPTLSSNPWSRSPNAKAVSNWRGSGQHGKLNYTGEVTTYGEAVGQEMLAPEVNTHNMLVMTQHLRNLGYKIPTSYDQNIRDLPRNYAQQLREAYNGVGHGNNPFDTIFAGFLDIFENKSGLDVENLLFNSIDLMSTD